MALSSVHKWKKNEQKPRKIFSIPFPNKTKLTRSFFTIVDAGRANRSKSNLPQENLLHGLKEPYELSSFSLNKGIVERMPMYVDSLFS